MSVTSEMEMLGPGELLADLETPDDAEAAATKNLKEGGADDGEDDWKGVLQGLTGKQLKGWLQKMSGDLGRALSGSAPADADDDPLMSSLRRFALYIPNLRLYIAGAKVRRATRRWLVLLSTHGPCASDGSVQATHRERGVGGGIR